MQKIMYAVHSNDDESRWWGYFSQASRSLLDGHDAPGWNVRTLVVVHIWEFYQMIMVIIRLENRSIIFDAQWVLPGTWTFSIWFRNRQNTLIIRNCQNTLIVRKLSEYFDSTFMYSWNTVLVLQMICFVALKILFAILI